jgi:hypothetical protein
MSASISAEELKWRYITWLHYERQKLADEIGARTDRGRVLIIEDASVLRFFEPWFRRSPDAEPAGDRAARVLRAAGVDLQPDPDGQVPPGHDHERKGKGNLTLTQLRLVACIARYARGLFENAPSLGRDDESFRRGPGRCTVGAPRG